MGMLGFEPKYAGLSLFRQKYISYPKMILPIKLEPAILAKLYYIPLLNKYCKINKILKEIFLKIYS
jgi:hypothetical protein